MNQINKQSSNSYNNSQIRSNSLKEKNSSNLRPSTAPSKNDINPTSGVSAYPISGNNSLRRLPSPNIKCKGDLNIANNYLNNNNSINSSNYGKIMMNSSAKYRSTSPMVFSNQGKNAVISYSGSFKGFPSKIMK